jgi:hypothetical protein
MQMIFQTLFGSRLYGTNLPDSDYDLKGVFLPTADEILLGRVKRVWTSPKPEDGDNEAHSLQRFLELLAEGQTMALDMLFAPGEYIKVMDPIWCEVARNADKILSKQCAGAIGYAKSQAAKYSLRGSRIQALEGVISVLRGDGNPLRGGRQLQDVLFESGGALQQLPTSSQKYIKIDEEPDASGIKFLTVCEKRIGLNCSAYIALQTFEHVLKGYGDRAHQAAEGGADWKALYHAVRVTEQTIELMETGKITFPRPNAADLLKIRRGEYTPEAIFERIEAGLQELYAAQAKSELQEKPDQEFIDQLVLRVHRELVNG